MSIRNVQLLEESVTTGKIAPDTVIPADVDETLAYNFSNTTGTWAGRTTGSFTGLLDGSHWTAGTAIVEALNISATGGTFSGRVNGLIDGSRYTAGTAIVEALNISSASGTFAGVYTGIANSTDTTSTVGAIGLDLIAKTNAANNFTSVSSTFTGININTSYSKPIYWQGGTNSIVYIEGTPATTGQCLLELVVNTGGGEGMLISNSGSCGIEVSNNWGTAVYITGAGQGIECDIPANFSDTTSTWAGIVNYKNSSGSLFSTGVGNLTATGTISTSNQLNTSGTLIATSGSIANLISNINVLGISATGTVSTSNILNTSGTLVATSGSIANLIANITVDANKTIDGVDVGAHIHTGGTSAGQLTTGWSTTTSTYAGVSTGPSTGSITGLLDGSHWSAGTAIVEALNISATGGTFAGIATGAIKGTLDNSHWTAGTAIVEALNISSASGTFVGVINSTDTTSTVGAIGLDLVAKTTAANNFTSVSSTFVGVVNSTNTTSTIGNLRASLQIAGVSIAIPIGSTNTPAAWNYGVAGGTFSGIPIVTFSETTSALTTGTAEYPSITALNTSSITISVRLAQTAGTMNAIGIYGY